jgi:Ca-activated chloride channel family protein
MSLLGPSFGDVKKEIKSIGKDVYFLLDLSKSMLANDLQPNRITRAKHEIRKIANILEGDRMGLIIFSSYSFLQCPITFDKSAFLTFLDACEVEKMPGGGTDIAAALEMVYGRLEFEKSSSKHKSKIIILASDGEDFSERAFDWVKKLAKNQVKIFTIGIGTESGGKIPTRTGFKKDTQGEEIITRLNKKFLKEIAEETNACYFEVNPFLNQTNQLIELLIKMEGEVISTKIVDYRTNKYTYFLVIGLFFLFLDAVMVVNIIKL